MHYQGGKYRFIKHITPIIQAELLPPIAGIDTLHSLFILSSSAIAPHRGD